MNSHRKSETTHPESTYIGIDVSKHHLDVFIPGAPKRRDPNTPKGRADLLGALKGVAHPRMVCEATGGYEQALVVACFTAGIEVSVVQPGRVRHFALAEGLLAKTDAIDARLLARYGEKMRPRCEVPTQPDAVRLRQMVEMRRVLVELITQTSNRLELAQGYLCEGLQAQLDGFKSSLARVNADIHAHLESSATLRAKAARLRQLKGAGPVLTATLLAYVPELGSVSDKTLASLVGVAPYARDSGNTSRRRYVRGGRGAVRRALYMAAVIAVRHNPILKDFYTRLRHQSGKPAKVALVAVMRKMLSVLNRLIADPQFSLA